MWQAINSLDTTSGTSELFWYSFLIILVWVDSYYYSLVYRKARKFVQLVKLKNTNQNSNEKSIQILQKDVGLYILFFLFHLAMTCLSAGIQTCQWKIHLSTKLINPRNHLTVLTRDYTLQSSTYCCCI